MKNTRLEILKDEEWVELILFESKSIKYNKVINKISKVEDRSISHTNTFSIPNVSQNIESLGLNIFNPYTLSSSLNKKYKSRYFADDTIIQEGFLVINNTKGGSINVNFIDGALSIVEKWGSTTFNELINDEELNIPTDYQIAIDELKNYQMPIDSILVPTSNVGSRGYKMALFPNNLNTIGSKFQKDDEGLRILDTFNPYQSRPIFNAKSLFDLATESYGFTPIYDDSVDWENVSKTFIVEKDLGKNENEDAGIETRVNDFTSALTDEGVLQGDGTDTLKGISTFPEEIAIRPQDVPQWDLSTDPISGGIVTGVYTYDDDYIILQPELDGGNVGELVFTINPPPGGTGSSSLFYGCWISIDNSEVIYSQLNVENIDGNNITINKTELNTIPTNADENNFLGIISQSTFEGYTSSERRNFFTRVVETFLPSGVISYDEFGQFLSDSIDLTYAAPKVTIKKMMSGIMHKEGILLNIDNKNKEIKFFSYGAYEDRKNEGNYNNFSKYFRRNEIIEHNTNFGNFYGILNRISLSEPYLGNSFDIKLNELELVKYKEFNTDIVSMYKDVSSVLKINFTEPYFEYENLGLGLVEQIAPLGELTQVRADGSTQGQFTGLEALANVNYATLPNGVSEWYNLIKNAVGVKGKFLLPLQVFKGLDISIPIYVSELGGYYIIEEIAEYENAQNMVVISLIKLIDNIRE